MNSLKASQFDQNQFIEAIKNDGYCVVEDLLDAATVKALKEANKQAIHKEMNYHGSSDYQHYGVVQCCPMYGEPYLSLVENRQLFDPFDLIMGEGSIIYVYITSSMPPNDGNFSSRIHVDRPRLFPNYCECLAGLIMLDDFTAENGSTYVLPGSHNTQEQPDEKYFNMHSIAIQAKAGSVLYFNLRLWHAGGINRTNQWRDAIAIGVVRPCLKQKFDIPGCIQDQGISDSHLSDYAKQKLGYFAIPPKNLNEFYGRGTAKTYTEKSEWEIAQKEKLKS